MSRVLALALACFLAAPVLSGCSALSAALPVIAAAAPVIETILTHVDKANAITQHNLPLLAKLYPDFPEAQFQRRQVQAYALVKSAAATALETARAAKSADDENLAAAMAHLRRAYDAYMDLQREIGSLDKDGRLRFADGSLLSEEPVPAGSAFRVE